MNATDPPVLRVADLPGEQATVSAVEAALLPMLAQLAAEGRPLEAMYQGHGWRAYLAVQPIHGGLVAAPTRWRGAAPQPTGPEIAARLSANRRPVRIRRIHRKLWEAASAEEPVPSKRLIPAAGYRLNNYALGVITELTSIGCLIRLPDGLVRGLPLPC